MNYEITVWLLHFEWTFTLQHLQTKNLELYLIRKLQYPHSVIGPGFIMAPVSPHKNSNKIIIIEVLGLDTYDLPLQDRYIGLERYFAGYNQSIRVV